MKLKLILSAMFRLKNLAILAVLLGISAILSNPAALPLLLGFPPIPNINLAVYPASVLVYLFFVVRTLSDRKFHENFNHRQKIRRIQDLNYATLRLSSQAKKHTNNTYMQKLKKVMEDKNDIVNSFFRGERNFLKEKIVEQTLNLVLSYIKLLTNFCIRSRELSTVDFGEITNRINMNIRKLSFAKDPGEAEDIKQVIKIDEKMVSRLKDEKRELEKINNKLEYMERTVNMFKHQIISSLESEEMLEELETAVNEATALDNVLEERRRNRVNIR